MDMNMTVEQLFIVLFQYLQNLSPGQLFVIYLFVSYITGIVILRKKVQEHLEERELKGHAKADGEVCGWCVVALIFSPITAPVMAGWKLIAHKKKKKV